MKKILFVVENLGGGGAEKVLTTLIRNLDESKYNITVFTVVETGVYVEELKKLCTVKFALKKYSNYSCFGKIYYRLVMFLIYHLNTKIIYKIFIKEKYDIEVGFVEGFDTKFVASSSNKKSRKYAWIHTDMINNTHANIHYKNIEEQKKVYAIFDRIFAVSDDVKKKFIKKYGIKNIDVQYNPIDSNEILKKSNEEKIQKDEGVLNFITIGRLEQQKGYIRLLEIVNQLKQNDYYFKLYILGEGSQRQQLEDYIKINQLEDYVELLGFQSNPYKYLIKSDCFICSSYSEGFSTVATEATILNIPIVTTRCSGMEELFGQYKCGIITDNDSKALFLGIKAILDNPKILNFYKKQITYRKKFFDINNRIKEIEGIFDE